MWIWLKHGFGWDCSFSWSLWLMIETFWRRMVCNWTKKRPYGCIGELPLSWKEKEKRSPDSAESLLVLITIPVETCISLALWAQVCGYSRWYTHTRTVNEELLLTPLAGVPHGRHLLVEHVVVSFQFTLHLTAVDVFRIFCWTPRPNSRKFLFI